MIEGGHNEGFLDKLGLPHFQDFLFLSDICHRKFAHKILLTTLGKSFS